MATKKAGPAKVAVPKRTAKAATATAYASTRDRVSTSLTSASLWRALSAEFIGTFLLASIIIVGQGQPIFVLFGLVGIVLLIGAVSGAHVNPAITIGQWATKRIDGLKAFGYIVVQVLGAIAAFYALKTFLGGAEMPSDEALSYGATAPQLFSAAAVSEFAGKEWYVVGAEILGTAILGYAVARATRIKDTLAGAFSIGAGIFIALMVGITAANYVGASSIINPAVATALQAYDASFWSYAIYAFAPVVGGVVGFVLHDAVSGKEVK